MREDVEAGQRQLLVAAGAVLTERWTSADRNTRILGWKPAGFGGDADVFGLDVVLEGIPYVLEFSAEQAEDYRGRDRDEIRSMKAAISAAVDDLLAGRGDGPDGRIGRVYGRDL